MDKDRIKGTVEQAKGAVKEAVGKAAGARRSFGLRAGMKKLPAKLRTQSAESGTFCRTL